LTILDVVSTRPGLALYLVPFYEIDFFMKGPIIIEHGVYTNEIA
jgi:hypothetical protein